MTFFQNNITDIVTGIKHFTIFTCNYLNFILSFIFQFLVLWLQNVVLKSFKKFKINLKNLKSNTSQGDHHSIKTT